MAPKLHGILTRFNTPRMASVENEASRGGALPR